MVKQITSEIGEEPTTLLPIPTRRDIERAGIKILIAVPLERTINFQAFVGMLPIFQQGWSFCNMQYGRTDVARSMAARTLLESDFTHLFMMDDDHIHMPDIVERHARWVMDDPDKLVVGGLHFRRGAPYDPCVFVKMPDGRFAAPVDWHQGIYRADVLGHGTLLVSRKAFEMLTPPFWRYTYEDGEYNFQSEDMYFSAACRAAGIQLWCDTTATSQHIINGVVDEGVYRAYLKDHPEIAYEVRGDAAVVPHADGVKLPDVGKSSVPPMMGVSGGN